MGCNINTLLYKALESCSLKSVKRVTNTELSVYILTFGYFFTWACIGVYTPDIHNFLSFSALMVNWVESIGIIYTAGSIVYRSY